VTTTARPVSLTAKQERVAALLVCGVSDNFIAHHLQCSPKTVRRHYLVTLRRKLAVWGCTRPMLCDALLTQGLVPPPVATRPAPCFTDGELTLLRNLTHRRPKEIAETAGTGTADVEARIGGLVALAGADNSTHLVGLARQWRLLDRDAGSQFPPAAGAAA
jgi:DNA-binding CsgD family transcriptional regulator